MVRVGSWQNGFFAELYFEPPDFSSHFVAGFPSFLWEKCPEKSSRKIPGKILPISTTKIPDTFLQRGRANNGSRNNGWYMPILLTIWFGSDSLVRRHRLAILAQCNWLLYLLALSPPRESLCPSLCEDQSLLKARFEHIWVHMTDQKQTCCNYRMAPVRFSSGTVRAWSSPRCSSVFLYNFKGKARFRLRSGGSGSGFLGKRSIHRLASVRNSSLPQKMGAQRGKISVVDKVFIGLWYLPSDLSASWLQDTVANANTNCDAPPKSGKKKAHKHKSFWQVTVRWGRGSLPVGCPGVKDLCAIFKTQGT